jgi:AcrR family transcriptional regulator
MTAQTTDRRTARTRTALRRAFVDLMLEQGYANLTAEVVAERADVARSTLYTHFGGLQGLLRATLDNPSAPLAGLVDGRTTHAQLVEQLQHFHEQRRRNWVFFEDPLRSMWVRRLAELIEPRLDASSGLPTAFVALQLAETQIAFVRSWLVARPAPRAEALAEAMTRATLALREALTRT